MRCRRRQGGSSSVSLRVRAVKLSAAVGWNGARPGLTPFAYTSLRQSPQTCFRASPVPDCYQLRGSRIIQLERISRDLKASPRPAARGTWVLLRRSDEVFTSRVSISERSDCVSSSDIQVRRLVAAVNFSPANAFPDPTDCIALPNRNTKWGVDPQLQTILTSLENRLAVVLRSGPGEDNSKTFFSQPRPCRSKKAHAADDLRSPLTTR
jgi:hypothetical protein